MDITEEIINGETYLVVTLPSGAQIRQLKITPAQQAMIYTLRAAEEARRSAREQSYAENLPSLSQVQTAVNNIANLADARAFLLKLSRVIYWLARDKAD